MFQRGILINSELGETQGRSSRLSLHTVPSEELQKDEEMKDDDGGRGRDCVQVD